MRVVNTLLMVAACVLISASASAAGFTAEMRARLEQEITQRVTRVAFVPGVDFSQWPTILAKYRAELDQTQNEATFAAVINRALSEFKQSHITLITPDQNEARKRGAQAGIGVGLQVVPEGLRVATVLDNSPASRVGLKAGELILLVNGVKPTSVTAVAGPVGTEFVLTVRDDQGKTRQVTVKREIYGGAKPATLTWPVPNRIAVLKIPTFERGYDVTRMARLVQEARGAETLIVDLRGNPGGFVFHMLHAAGLLLPDGRSIGTIVTRYSMDRYVRETGSKPNDLNGFVSWSPDKLKVNSPSKGSTGFGGKFMVLTDGGTGSAAEMLGAALRDVGGAKVVGERSAGMVLAATIMELSGGFAIMVPLQDYVTIGGTRLEGNGIKPDVDTKPESGKDAALLAAVQLASAVPPGLN